MDPTAHVPPSDELGEERLIRGLDRIGDDLERVANDLERANVTLYVGAGLLAAILVVILGYRRPPG